MATTTYNYNLQLQLRHTTLHYIYTYTYTYTDTDTCTCTCTYTYSYTYTTLHYATLRYTTLHYATLRYATLHYTTLHYNCATPRYIQELWCGDHCNHCNHSKKHSSNHLSVHQQIRSAIRDSQQPTSPISFLFLKLPPPSCSLLLVCYMFFVILNKAFVLHWCWRRGKHSEKLVGVSYEVREPFCFRD